MAEDNYKMIETMNDNMWFIGSPVILCSMRLALDMKTGDVFTSAKFQNVMPENIRSISFDVICYDESREPINKIENVTFGELDVPRNTEFGFHRKIKVPDIRTRNAEYVIRSVSFSDGQSFENTEYRRFDTKIEQKNIYSVQGDYNKQFLDLCARSGIDGINLVLQPEFDDDHWLCACGAFNWSNEEKCSQCRISRSWLIKNTDLEALKKRREAQEADAQQVKELVEAMSGSEEDRAAEKAEYEAMNDRIKAEQKKRKSQRLRRSIVIILGLLIVTAGIIYILMTFVFPDFLEAEEYLDGTDIVNTALPADTGIYDRLPLTDGAEI